MNAQAKIWLEFSSSFKRGFKKLKRKDQAMAKRLYRCLETFQVHPFHQSLKTHKLKGDLQDRYAFSVHQNLRVIFRWVTDTHILLVAFGTHDQMYR